MLQMVLVDALTGVSNRQLGPAVCLRTSFECSKTDPDRPLGCELEGIGKEVHDDATLGM